MIWLQRGDDESGWTVWILEQETCGLTRLPDRLRELLQSPDFSDRAVSVLFPQAYPDDEAAEAEYQRLLRDDLVRRKLDAVNAVERTLEGGRRHKSALGPTVVELHLSDAELTVWLGFLHDARLVIGTSLDITEEGWEHDLDPDDPDFPELLLLNQLSYFEEAFIDAIRDAEGLAE